jgi:hypothetical protein
LTDLQFSLKIPVENTIENKTLSALANPILTDQIEILDDIPIEKFILWNQFNIFSHSKNLFWVCFDVNNLPLD